MAHRTLNPFTWRTMQGIGGHSRIDIGFTDIITRIITVTVATYIPEITDMKMEARTVSILEGKENGETYMAVTRNGPLVDGLRAERMRLSGNMRQHGKENLSADHFVAEGSAHNGTDAMTRGTAEAGTRTCTRKCWTRNLALTPPTPPWLRCA